MNESVGVGGATFGGDGAAALASASIFGSGGTGLVGGGVFGVTCPVGTLLFGVDSLVVSQFEFTTANMFSGAGAAVVAPGGGNPEPKNSICGVAHGFGAETASDAAMGTAVDCGFGGGASATDKLFSPFCMSRKSSAGTLALAAAAAAATAAAS